jgi:hypothetical protein
MSTISVIPSVEPLSGGFMLRVDSADTQRAWRKWYGSEGDAYVDAVNTRLAHDEYFGSTRRRRLDRPVSIEIEHLEYFGLRQTEY